MVNKKNILFLLLELGSILIDDRDQIDYLFGMSLIRN